MKVEFDGGSVTSNLRVDGRQATARIYVQPCTKAG